MKLRQDIYSHRSTATAVAALAALLLTPVLGLAQPRPQLPPPETTDPVSLGLMQGFPPPADKTVRLASVLKFPNARWAYHHMRELGPTTAVWRGDAAPSPLPSAPLDLDELRLDDGQGNVLNLYDWQRSTYTDALLILHRGRIVYERYDAGMTPRQPHALNSLSKSLVGLLARQLILEGRIDPGAPVSRYLPELKDSAWSDATVQQTLDMTTGVQYEEDFGKPSSGVFQYLMAAGLLPPQAGHAGPPHLLAYLPTVKKSGEHGAGFQYKSVDTEVMGWLLQRVSGQRLSDLLSERIWAPLGAGEDAYLWTDGHGGQVASVGISATARDLARLGEMLRRGGRSQDRQVLDPRVVAELRKGGDPEKFKAAGQAPRAGYSYHDYWWIPHDDDGTFEAKGLNGQHLHINPASEMVLVKFSSHPVPNTLHTHTLDRNAFEAIAQALRERPSTP